MDRQKIARPPIDEDQELAAITNIYLNVLRAPRQSAITGGRNCYSLVLVGWSQVVNQYLRRKGLFAFECHGATIPT